MPLSEARKRANKKWNEKNKEKMGYYHYLSATKRFIRTSDNIPLLEELATMIKDRIEELKKEGK